MDKNQEQQTNQVSIDDFFDLMVENMLTLKKNYKLLMSVYQAAVARIKELEAHVAPGPKSKEPSDTGVNGIEE